MSDPHDTTTSSSSQHEALDVRSRYARRDAATDSGRYSLSNAYALAAWQERQRRMIALLKDVGMADFAQLDVLEVGSGNGGILQDFLRLGVPPQQLQGIELLAERAEAARAVLPAACHVWHGDALDPAMEQHIAPQSQDLVVLFTVFSSILSAGVQQQLADQVWRWLRPGGAVLWHDFVYDNPRNLDVRGVPVKQLHSLFPGAEFTLQRATLAPPLGRAACQIHPALYPLLNSIPWLRTHVLCLISKPLP